MPRVQVDAEKLREIVNERGLKTDFLAKKVGLKTASFRYILNGQRNPSLPVLKLLALELGVEIEALQLASKSA